MSTGEKTKAEVFVELQPYDKKCLIKKVQLISNALTPELMMRAGNGTSVSILAKASG